MRKDNLFLYLARPDIFLKVLIRHFNIGSFEFKERFDAHPRPSYAFGIYRAAKEAVALGYDHVSIIEFGVARGRGLMAMTEIIAEVKKIFPSLSFTLYGFDTLTGLPKIDDPRDQLYLWGQGEFPHEKPLPHNAQLIVGDVKDSLKKFFADNPPPIAFISFDLDLYSSTVEALAAFDFPEKHFLPRVLCYFDDIMEDKMIPMYNDYSGERLAIHEFNAKHPNKKISPLYGLGETRLVRASWPAAMYVYHGFSHTKYNQYIKQKLKS